MGAGNKARVLIHLMAENLSWGKLAFLASLDEDSRCGPARRPNHHWPTIDRRFGSAAESEQPPRSSRRSADQPPIYGLSPPASRRRRIVRARCAWCSICRKVDVYNASPLMTSLFSIHGVSHTSLLIIGWGGTRRWALFFCCRAFCLASLFLSTLWHCRKILSYSCIHFWSEESLKLRRFCVSLS